MNVLYGALMVAGATAVAVAAMLLVRRRAPEGSYFTDGDRASGVFGVLATGFSVLLGFIIFLAFSSYDESRCGRRDRGDDRRAAGARPRSSSPAVGRRADRRARLLRPVGRRRRVGRDRHRHAGRRDQPVGCPACSRPSTVNPRRRPSSRPTTGGWTRPRPGAGAHRPRPRCRGHHPAPLWLVLFVISGVIFVYMLFFADSGRGAVTQAC